MRTYSPPASGRRYCLRQSCVWSGLPGGCAQLHGGSVAALPFLCRANPVPPFSGFLTGAVLARFHFAGQYSVRETNAQPAPATGLFKGFGTLSQQAKTDFRRPRRKSVLSICGNKCTACYNGDTPKNGGDGRPMQRPTPKLQWEGTGLTRHCLSCHARLRKLSAGPLIAAFDLRRLRSGQHRPLVSHSKLNR